jgi:hypothetical protein
MGGLFLLRLCGVATHVAIDHDLHLEGKKNKLFEYFDKTWCPDDAIYTCTGKKIRWCYQLLVNGNSIW